MDISLGPQLRLKIATNLWKSIFLAFLLTTTFQNGTICDLILLYHPAAKGVHVWGPPASSTFVTFSLPQRNSAKLVLSFAGTNNACNTSLKCGEIVLGVGEYSKSLDFRKHF